MKSINFTNQELESMIEMYTAEMEEAQMYIAQIQDILKKLGAKPAKVKPVEQESKQGNKRGRKPAVKTVEKAESKKRGRKPNVVAPSIESAIPSTPIKKEVKKNPEPKKKIEFKAKVGKKAVNKAAPLKVVSAPVPTAKSKVVVEKKPVVKPTPKKKTEKKVAATVESVVTSLLTKEPKKEVKKVAKTKSTEKKRIDEMATSAKLVKPKTKKTPKVKTVVETVPDVPTVTPTE